MTIKKGTHAPCRLPRLLIGTSSLVMSVSFDKSCIYDIGSEQGDVNKLFGIGYFPHHRFKSVRVGWNYNLQTKLIDLFSYWYAENNLTFNYLESTELYKNNIISIDIEKDKHTIHTPSVIQEIYLPSNGNGYLLREYFGGQTKAPHDISINSHLVII